MLAGYLRQSTAVTVPVGPFVSSTDGDTESTALTISQADVRLKKNGGDAAQKNNASSLTHDELGVYDCPLSTTDTNTLGILSLIVHESGALIVRHDYMVVPANIWDSWFASDLQQVDVREHVGVTAISGAIPAVAAGANGGLPTVNGSNYIAGMAGTINTLDGLDTAQDTQHATTQGRLPAALVSGRMASDAVAISGSTAAADAVEANIGNLDASVAGRASQSSVDDLPTNAELAARTLAAADYATATALATVDDVADAILADTATLGTPAGASHAADNAAIKADTAAILEDTGTTVPAQIAALNNLSSVQAQTAAAAALTAYDPPTRAEATADKDEILADLATADGKLDAIGSGMALDSTVAKEATVAALENLSAADVNAQVVDALATDSYADPSALAGAMGSSLSLAAKVNWMFARMFRRRTFNKTTGEHTVYNSSNDIIAKSTGSDDGTTTEDSQAGAP